MKGKILIGHALHNDLHVFFQRFLYSLYHLSLHLLIHFLKALHLEHPSADIRDTSKSRLLRQFANLPLEGTPSLKRLSHHLLGIGIQQGEHDSVCK